MLWRRQRDILCKNIVMLETAEGKRFAKAITKKQREILQQFDAYNLILASLD